MTKRSLGIALLSFYVIAAGSSSSAAGEKRRGKQPSRTTVRAEGASLVFTKLALPADASDEPAVLEKLRELKGTLKLEKDVKYRRTTLPAGSYPLAIARDSSGKYFFVIGKAPKQEEKKKKKSPDTLGMGIAGDYLWRLAEEGKSEDTKKKSRSRKGRSSRKTPSEKDEDSEKKPEQKAAEAEPWLRARMHFVALEKGTSEACLDLKSIESGKKLEISACAGTNCGRARLTFVASPGS